MKPRFFATPDDFRRWLERHHARAPELWVGFHKRGTGVPSITWPESVDAALSFGWIDGVRKRLDAERYVIRFTPRRPGSIWSAVNVRRIQALKRKGLMHAAGLAAFAKRTPARTGVYSFEQRPHDLPPRFLKAFKARPKAWAHFRARPPWYRRTVAWWIVSAKQEATRERRFAILLAHSERGQPIPSLDRTPASPRRE
ncbi:MAG TPA: YdeI/OmpD-associated family protein [Candidatus Eisenbacteria bacterium]|nr:YdeI/OmpD-associated family protein [Candidatus Eisenbacteria bacterium]